MTTQLLHMREEMNFTEKQKARWSDGKMADEQSKMKKVVSVSKTTIEF